MENFLTVDMSKKPGISIGAAGLSGLEQEVRTVLATRKGSVPLDRDFGISWDFVDKPLTEAMPYMVAEIASSWSAMCRASGGGILPFQARTRWAESPAHSPPYLRAGQRRGRRVRGHLGL